MKILSWQGAAEETARILRRPGAVALAPTETVYGLICAWDDAAARARIYALKRRSADKPCAAFVLTPDSLPAEAAPLPEAARKIAAAFCPGPVTLVVPDRYGSTFGFRIPDHPFIRQLLQLYGGALASTSANLSGSPPALSVAEGLNSIDGEPDLAIDGGVLSPGSRPSTVIRVRDDSTWEILREGPVSRDDVAQALTHTQREM